jgi:hypothetical protein
MSGVNTDYDQGHHIVANPEIILTTSARSGGVELVDTTTDASALLETRHVPHGIPVLALGREQSKEDRLTLGGPSAKFRGHCSLCHRSRMCPLARPGQPWIECPSCGDPCHDNAPAHVNVAIKKHL